MPKTKKFIDKKNAVTFHLVHRSQQDPLITDETAPQHVLVQSETPIHQSNKPVDKVKLKTEQQKFGVFFDDDYNYLQHLRQPGQNTAQWEYVEPSNVKNKESNKTNLQLPSSVFASEFEEDEGLLRKAALHLGPRPELDPDIVAALDDDFDYNNPDNELEDNFMEMAAGGDCGYEDDDEYSDIDSNFDENDEDRDELGPLRMYVDEETKSRFTEYSMSSSVIRRNEQLQLLDERFEKFYERYDEPEIGPLDCEEIEGHVEMSEDLMEQCLVEYKQSTEYDEYKKEWDCERIRKLAEDDSSSDEELLEVPDEREKKWDCESILSTYSNIYNHPKLIEEPKKKVSKIRINRKTGVPENVFHGENNLLTSKALAKFDTENSTQQSQTPSAGPKSLCAQSVLSTLSVLSIRPKDETPEEKRERKRLLKDYRNERRIERKANTYAFKDEKMQQDRIKINNRNNIQGKTIV